MSLARYAAKLAALLGSDGKVPQAALAANVAGNGPAFSAGGNGSQSLAVNTWAKIQFVTEDFDTGSRFNNTGSTVGGIPAYAFMPDVAGYYQITGKIQAASVACAMGLDLYKNGSQHKRIADTSSATTSAIAGTVLVYLNGSTDYVELYGLFSSAQSPAGSSLYSFFQAAMVRAA